MSYPFLSRVYATYQETKLLEQWENGEGQNRSDVAAASFLNLDHVFTGDSEPSDDHESPADGELLGTLTIEKIGLEIPILNGAGQSNLKIAGGKLTGTDPLDAEFGNTAIAAHRSYTYGHQFNRLDELETGDKLVVNTNSGTYHYTVYNKVIVEPTDVSVLEKKNEERVVTLITCEPIREATHRLIIQAKP